MKTREAELLGLDQFLAGKPEQHPALVGVLALLAEFREEAEGAGATLGVPGDDRAFLAGRQSALRDIAESLQQRWEQGQVGPSA